MKLRPGPSRFGLPWTLLCLALLACGGEQRDERPEGEPPAVTQLDLISIDYDDEVREADQILKRRLESELAETTPIQIDVSHHRYDAAVELLADKQDDADYLAWLTPYVFVVAEMLGAEFEAIGTYRSKAVLEGRQKRLQYLREQLGTLAQRRRELNREEERLAETADASMEQLAELERSLGELEDRQQALERERQQLEDQRKQAGFTYRSYFVVNREQMERKLGPLTREPALPALDEYLRALERDGTKPTFYYHSKFSTSSFFLPSVYFRDHGMVDLVRAVDIRISLGREGETVSSKRLVEKVADSKEPALAAVWDGTKSAFDPGGPLEEYGPKVYFIALESELPNDLLVASSSMDQRVRDSIRRAIEEMPAEDKKIEFQLWRPIDAEETRRAKSALIGLRQLAREQISPVTISIEDSGAATPAEVRAAEDAIRLSGTEFVLWNEFYARKDFRWKLEPTHDGAINLLSEIVDLPDWKQKFLISYENPTDLTERIGDLIRERMHRLRHVWPYSKLDTPTILRDVDFSVAAGETIEVQRIVWRDRKSNDFQSGSPFAARVLAADSRKFKLSRQGFEGGFNPMGSVSYRAVLPRPSEERPLFKILTAALLLLFLGGTVAAVLELRRKPYVHVAATDDVIAAAFRERVERYHEPWRAGAVRDVTEADVLEQDRDSIEVFIAELRLAEGPWWQRALRRVVSAREDSEDDTQGLTRELLVRREEIGGTARLVGLIEYLLRKERLSQFIGTSIEYQAWNQAACRLFAESVSAAEEAERPEPRLLDSDGDGLTQLVSRHFSEVLRDAGREVSFFCKVWEMRRNPDGGRFSFRCRCEEELPVALDHHCEALDAREGEPITHLRIEFKLGAPINLTVVEGQMVEAWLLGILDRRPTVIEGEEGRRCLRLHFKALALVRGPAC